MPATAQDVIALAKEQDVEFVDLKFTDLPGRWQHFSLPARELTEELFEEGIGFDGSSIQGFQEIHESDMLLLPDPITAFLDPFCARPTLSIICDIADPLTREPYSRDPRYVARKAENYLKSTGVADVSYWGPEAEFFIFDSIHYKAEANESFYKIGSQEAIWAAGDPDEGGRQGYKPRWKMGYFPVPPTDHFQDLRSEMVAELTAIGVDCEVHHHEVATAGQAEIDMRFDSLLAIADKLMKHKYVVRNVAWRSGLCATFMPKPIFGDNGSGMHTHQSLWKNDENAFFDESGYGLLSRTAFWYIGGLLKHAPALLALTAPTTNSYKRLVPGYEAPINLCYSARNRSACVRIPVYSPSPRLKRIEFRPPDCTCNPYLAFSAMLMAGLDGIQNKIDPGDPVDKNLYDLSPEEAVGVKSTPTSLLAVLEALEQDHDFLLRGDVFTSDLIERWISFKREEEAYPVANRPHPYEFYLYFDL